MTQSFNLTTNSVPFSEAYRQTLADRLSPAKLILDTDIGNDIDDALALTLIHTLQRQNECDLLTVTINTPNKYSPVYTDIVNTFYAKGSIPIGITDQGPKHSAETYTEQIVKKGIFRSTRSASFIYPSAIDLLRQTLASQPDQSVIIVGIGFFNNLARLLDSQPDAFSPLNGMELIRQKVKFLSSMAGNFSPQALDVPSAKYKEYNIYMDVESARFVLSKWPTPIVLSGFEIGETILYSAESIENDFRWAQPHPLVEAYKRFNKMPYDRPCWDLTSVFFAVRPANPYLTLSHPGFVTIFDEGHHSFTPNPAGPIRYLQTTQDQAAHLAKTFHRMCSKPYLEHIPS